MVDIQGIYNIASSVTPEIEPFEEWSAFWTDKDSAIWPIGSKSGELIGAVMFKFNTVHICVKPEWQGHWVRREHLDGLKAWKHEVPIIAAIPEGNTKAVKFATRLGFTYKGNNQGFDVLIKEI